METDIQLVDDPALNNISSINTRQTLLIVNDFIAHTVDFMNKFVTISEQKLYHITQKTEKLDILISLLEAKLESIPLHETDYRGPATSSQVPVAAQEETTQIGPQPPGPPPGGPQPPPPPAQSDFSSGSNLSAAAEKALAQINGEAEAQQQAPVTSTPAPAPAATSSALIDSSGGLIKDDPRYKKYFSMIARGVPLPAVMQKISIEGEGLLDPSILNFDPNTPVSATGLSPIVDGDESD